MSAPRLFSRLVALLLVPCLLADPILAHGLPFPSHSDILNNVSRLQPSFMTQEAFAPRLINARQIIKKASNSRAVVTTGRLLRQVMGNKVVGSLVYLAVLVDLYHKMVALMPNVPVPQKFPHGAAVTAGDVTIWAAGALVLWIWTARHFRMPHLGKQLLPSLPDDIKKPTVHTPNASHWSAQTLNVRNPEHVRDHIRFDLPSETPVAQSSYSPKPSTLATHAELQWKISKYLGHAGRPISTKIIDRVLVKFEQGNRLTSIVEQLKADGIVLTNSDSDDLFRSYRWDPQIFTTYEAALGYLKEVALDNRSGGIRGEISQGGSRYVVHVRKEHIKTSIFKIRQTVFVSYPTRQYTIKERDAEQFLAAKQAQRFIMLFPGTVTSELLVYKKESGQIKRLSVGESIEPVVINKISIPRAQSKAATASTTDLAALANATNGTNDFYNSVPLDILARADSSVSLPLVEPKPASVELQRMLADQPIVYKLAKLAQEIADVGWITGGGLESKFIQVTNDFVKLWIPAEGLGNVYHVTIKGVVYQLTFAFLGQSQYITKIETHGRVEHYDFGVFRRAA